VFGDFQTPRNLADEICALLRHRGERPRSILEPTCGQGSLLVAAAHTFPEAQTLAGFDINPAHVATAATALEAFKSEHRIVLGTTDFFSTDWNACLEELPRPILVIGNPPWATNAGQSRAGGRNTPNKVNHGQRGIDAITGSSNFDLTEAMLYEMLAWPHAQTIAMLCKTAAARKALIHLWNPRSAARGRDKGPKGEGGGRPPDTPGMGRTRSTALHAIDAAVHFSAAVDACLFTARQSDSARANAACSVYQSLASSKPTHTIGLRHGALVGDTGAYDHGAHLGRGAKTRWRSGVKHDCARVLEFTTTITSAHEAPTNARPLHSNTTREPTDKPTAEALYRANMPGRPSADRSPSTSAGCEARTMRLTNGLGETVELEPDYIYPLLKSSDLAHGRPPGRRWVLVTQSHTSTAPDEIEHRAPRTWAYLQKHSAKLDARRSAVYRKRPRFSVFGIGPYSFAPWKVAISGLYKSFTFRVVGPHVQSMQLQSIHATGAEQRPVMLDDTCYFLPCASEDEAQKLYARLMGSQAQAFLRSLVFWDSKRPITSRLLGRLSIAAMRPAP